MPQIKLYHPKYGYVKEFEGDSYKCELWLKKWKSFYGKKFEECQVERIEYSKSRKPKEIVYRPTGDIYPTIKEASIKTKHTVYTVKRHLKNNFITPPEKGRLFHYLEE